MEKKKFIEELSHELIRRGIDEQTVAGEMVPVRSFFEENGIEDVEVTVGEMADEIEQMIRDDENAADGTADISDSGNGTVSVEDEIEQAIKSVESGRPILDFGTNGEKDNESDTDSADAKPEDNQEDFFAEAVAAADAAQEAGNVREAQPETEEEQAKPAPAVSGKLFVPVSEKIASLKKKKKRRNGEENEENKLSPAKTKDTFANDGNSGDFAEYENESDSGYPDEQPDESDDDMKIAPSADDEEIDSDSDDVDYFEGDVDVEEYRPLSAAEKKKRKKKKRHLSADENPQLTEDNGEEYNDEKLDRLVENIQTNKALFWVVFAISLPIVIALALLCVAIYIGFWIALAILMIAIVTGLILFVSAGAIISLVGIVYGAIQLIKGVTPVGMFEIGLGVTVGAAVMFAGIIVYNIAIRLIPFIMKLLAKLLAVGFKKTKEGYIALKGVLDRI